MAGFGPRQQRPEKFPRSRARLLWRFAAAATAAVTALALLFTAGAVPAATASYSSDYLMCGWRVEARTQTVFIDTGDPAVTGLTRDDVVAAFEQWNALFRKYHGFDIFTEYTGNWWEADILVTADGSARTWVNTVCSDGETLTGNNKAVVYVGEEDAWRNAGMIAHELGHALGLADFGLATNHESGHVGYKPCGNYVGVMSYCASPQTWFLDGDYSNAGLVVDGQLVRDYFQP